MNASLTKGIIIGGLATVALSTAGVIGYQTLSQPKYAEVLGVKPVSETIKQAREECRDVEVKRQAPVKDENRIAGTVIGGVIGGALGSTIGSGTGKTVATVAGAAAGGYAGNKVQKNMQEKDVETHVERQCKTVYDHVERPLGFDVTYSLNGKQDTIRLDHDPGTRIPVKDGKLVLETPSGAHPAKK